ncbi:TRAP transporter small permease [Petroclostridium sp. X23]|uniref:TRAP transporter small permease n=1 Tax=Petroclostridium sp. X23 TaxID=3045146 RepID=UPI0024AD4737|nr:TRAP transporter small permease [Petroclostridium sp. X23]WHH57023.1 TRAP transporter small permease [Petroclostridium sp. X23]
MKVLKYLNERIEEIMLVGLLGSMAGIIGIQVFMRYVMRNSLSWSEEIARYMFVWLVYIGISYGVKKKAHIKVEAALMILPEKMKTVVFFISDFLFLFFATFITYKSYEMCALINELDQVSPAMGIKMAFVYMALPVGYALISLRLIQNIIERINAVRKGELK